MTLKFITFLMGWFLAYTSCYLTEDKLKEYYRSVPKVDFSKADAVKTDVVYHVFRNASQKVRETVTEETVGSANLDKSVPTVLIFHGWTTDDTSPWFDPIRQAYFETGPHNIIYINWSTAGNKSYSVSSANVLPVGKYIAEFLIASEVPGKNIHLVGHSLGSQLTGFIGKAFYKLTGKKIGRITALDPAGPAFDNSKVNCDSRLCENDAEFVDVIHTDIQLYGYTSPMGHVDFYPNGGGHQPGCPSREVDDNCSHACSTLFFVESIRTKVYAQEAIFEDKDLNVTVKPKTIGKKVIFGQHIDRLSRGIYYIETNSEKPFLK